MIRISTKIVIKSWQKEHERLNIKKSTDSTTIKNCEMNEDINGQETHSIDSVNIKDNQTNENSKENNELKL